MPILLHCLFFSCHITGLFEVFKCSSMSRCAVLDSKNLLCWYCFGDTAAFVHPDQKPRNHFMGVLNQNQRRIAEWQCIRSLRLNVCHGLDLD